MDNQQPSLLFKSLKEDSDYLIYENGKLFSKKTNKWLKGKIDNVGYLTYALAIGDKRNEKTGKKLSKMCYAHRLVAEYFLDNPGNLPIVNHKDENKLNNHYSNLEWVTEKQNTQYSIKQRERKKPKYFIKNLDGELWKIIPDYPNYSVSNFARIRNNKTNRLLHFDESQTYSRVDLCRTGERPKHFYVHRIVYCVFHNDFELDNYVIDHVDANPKNNNLDNLQKISQSENCLKQERFKK